MDIKKRRKIIWLIVILAVVIVAAIIATVLIVLGSRQDRLTAGNYGHISPKPVTKGKVDARDGYVKVAESDSYELWYYEPYFSIKLVNKATGAVIESTLSDEKDDGKANEVWSNYMHSGIVINAIRGTTNTYQVDVNSVPTDIATWYTDGGIYAQIDFKGNYMFGLGIEVRLEGDELVVRVPEESIYENKENTYINTVSLFPFMGYTHLGDEAGYMLVPDGNGALINLDDKEGRYATGFTGLIYGDDYGLTSKGSIPTLWEKYETVTNANKVLIPVFGMAHTDEDQAYLAIVEKGDERAYIEVQPNGVNNINYNRCFTRFLLRDVYQQPLSKGSSGTVQAVEPDRLHTDLQVRYKLLSGESANYSGMANAYRQYLLDSGDLQRQNLSYNTRVDVLGTEREEFLMGTTSVPMTTVDQVRDIYAALRREGVANVLTVYRGWQKGGLYNVPITEYKADGNIGGTHDLTKLILDEAENGYTVYLYDDALSVNATTNSSTYSVMKMVNKRTYEAEGGQVYRTFYFLMPDKAGLNLAALADDLNAKNIKNVALAGITNKLFTFTYKGNYYSRTHTMDTYLDAMSEVEGDLNLIMETPNEFMWKYAGAMIDMPLGTSDYLYIDQEIPFLSMVLKGIVPMYSCYVNFEANKTENFLQMVESGMYPSFYVAGEDSSKLIYTNSSDLYSLEFDSYRDTIAQYDRELRALAETVGTACIVNHEILPNSLVKVTYDNGVVIYINYTESALTDGNVTVDALSYKVGE